MGTRKDVRILLVGDSGVGKTSLILSLVSEDFLEEVPHRAEEIIIPADVTPENIPTYIVDYSVAVQTEESLDYELKRSHVICVVYAVDNEDSIERITTYWLPYVRKVLGPEHSKPVILVGNKVDLLDISSMEIIKPIMYDFVEVETCVECSARTLKNISEMFYYAQKAVLHPTAPVYDAEEKELTDKCKKSLIRIFKICDMNNDGLLDDNEINVFQQRCFNAPLHPQALEDVKLVVKRHISDGIQNDCLTCKGFLFLHTLFIQRGRHETTWTVLRNFGYDDALNLTSDYLSPEIHIPDGSTAELSRLGYEFLLKIFDRYDKDRDGCLSPTELQSVFSTCLTMPWGPDVLNTVCTDGQRWITKSGFLAQWTLTTLLDVRQTFECFAHLGYNYYHNSQQSAINVTREKKIDLERRQTSRKVFQCCVLGGKFVGKTAFLQGLLGRNLRYVATLNKDHMSSYSINTVRVYGQDMYLTLHEVDSSLCDLISHENLTNTCDVVCLLYDVTNPASFEFIANLYTRNLQETRVPTLIVACKNEQAAARQDYALTPVEFCKQYGLPPPQSFTCIEHINSDVYIKLCTMAAFPYGKNWVLSDYPAIKIGFGIVAASGLGYLLYKLLQSRS